VGFLFPSHEAFSVLNSPLGRLRLAGLLEGVSCVLLFGVAMPLKYLAKIREPMFAIGLAHGVLFMLFVACTLVVARLHRWPLSRLALAAVASVVPGGTFVFDATLKREQDALESASR
jgi:integral membrane protein